MSGPGIDRERIEEAVVWLLGGARPAASPEEVLRELAERLEGAGSPLARLAVFARTLHPSMFGRAFIWRPGEAVETLPVGFDVVASGNGNRNPFARVVASGEPYRRRLTTAEGNEYAVLDELAAAGATDYLALPLIFTDGSAHAVTFASPRPGGFTPEDLEAMERIRLPLARVAEIYALKRTARVLLDTYLGHQSGERVLNGMIRRGDGERINAVIWFTDLRHSTDLADRLPHEQFLRLLNTYFEAMAGAVLAHDGEVLRFIGDAALAIFPVGAAPGDPGTACRAASAAARDALSNIAVINDERRAEGEVPIEIGIGLHLGDVTYGNVGAENRLEFTVIGAAANEAARIEALCKTLGEPLLASAPVVAHLGAGWKSMGRHALHGVGREMEVFARAGVVSSGAQFAAGRE